MEKKYIYTFLFASIFLLCALSIDNIFWITASPEWDTVHTVTNAIGTWTGKVYDYTFGELINYIFGYRIYSVWSNWRDISAAIVFGATASFILFIINKVLNIYVFESHKRRKR